MSDEKKPEQAKKYDLPWERILGCFGFAREVLLYSHYFKKVGIPQKLVLGDWYCTLPNYQPFLYTKHEVDTFEDVQFLTSGKYVRILTPNECWAIILACGYTPATFEALSFSFDQEDTEVTVRVENKNGEALGVTSGSLHEALISLAFRIYILSKNISDFSVDIVNEDVGKEEDENSDA